MDFWFLEQEARLRYLPNTKRYLYKAMDWSPRCLGILGARGTGKTTMMLQYLSEHQHGSEKALYVAVDHPKFQNLSLYEFGREFSSYGGQILLLDEVHKYDNWAGHIKTLYDTCPDLQIIFSGSSILQLQDQDADLSRRAVMHTLHGLSFREFLFFELGVSFPVLDVEDILRDHVTQTRHILRQIKPLEHFRQYLQYGYYPFFLEGTDVYGLKLGQIINHVLEVDLPLIKQIDLRQVSKLKKLITFLAVNVPSKVNIQKLSSHTEISRPKIYEYLESLEQAKLLNLIKPSQTGYKILSKPDKIYLENPNLMYALSDAINIGTLRETFFVNQMGNTIFPLPSQNIRSMCTARQGDFVVNETYTFEIGGRNKGGKQIQGLENAFIAADEVESGFGNRIPLWLFGFLS